MSDWVLYRLLQSSSQTILAVFIGLSLATAYVGYDYYKVLAWPTTSAVVKSIDTKCVYSKKRVFQVIGSKYHRVHLDCNAREDARKLVADGYREDGKSAEYWVIYEPEPGRKIRAILNRWSIDTDIPGVGEPVRVRYSRLRPGYVEYASELGHKGTVLGVLIIGLVGFGCALVAHLPDFQRR